MGIDYDNLFCLVDDFCKAFEPWYRKQLIFDGKAKRNRECHLSLSEVLTILIAYHQSGMSCFKYFYFNSFSFHQELYNGPRKLDREKGSNEI